MASKKAIAVLSKQLEYLLGEPIDGRAVEIWQKVLSPISDDLLERAALKFLRKEERRYSIMPGAIYQTALEIMQEGLPTPGEAWAMLGVALDKVVDKEGWDAFNELPKPVQKAAQQVGVRGMVNGDHLMADRARFLEFYRVITDRQAEARLALPSSAQDAITEGEE
jgi:hypothetical protein